MNMKEKMNYQYRINETVYDALINSQFATKIIPDVWHGVRNPVANHEIMIQMTLQEQFSSVIDGLRTQLEK